MDNNTIKHSVRCLGPALAFSLLASCTTYHLRQYVPLPPRQYHGEPGGIGNHKGVHFVEFKPGDVYEILVPLFYDPKRSPNQRLVPGINDPRYVRVPVGTRIRVSRVYFIESSSGDSISPQFEIEGIPGDKHYVVGFDVFFSRRPPSEYAMGLPHDGDGKFTYYIMVDPKKFRKVPNGGFSSPPSPAPRVNASARFFIYNSPIFV
jgi:hypothetical protein